ncbi:hypothetical protein GJ688_06920 [Heliobacillus mobilis]|uniref:Uncharacterized protein n=1 Tax=Heliobacterium mobile TaxID=28064 RepID=A0A6I3SIP4_HELMO|nr:hypothetical protein [Heliobacterium mobile]MTV48710.1 hypothetical protein [Heliobacterium mobile]
MLQYVTGSRRKGLIALMISLLITVSFLAGCSSSKSAPVSTDLSALETPKDIKDMPKYLESLLPAEAKGNITIGSLSDGRRGVVAMFPLTNDPQMKAKAQQFARDFILATYRTDFPIGVAAITMSEPDGKTGLTVIVGAEGAKDLKQNPAMDTASFLEWAKKSKTDSDDPSKSVQITGDLLN